MSNSYYNHGSYPTTGAPGASSALRAELDLITTGFALLPTLSGNANKALVINAGGSAVTVTTGTLALAGNFATTGAFNTTLVQGATTSLTLPVVSGTLATLAGTETLSNKTLVAPALGTPASGIMTNVTGTAAGLTAGNVTTNANLTGDVTSVGNATSIAAGVIVNADINASAAIDDTKLATIATALKVSNSATTAASANTASAIVARDASGDFTAGTVTAALTGNSSTATALATGRTIAITGDLAYTSPSFDGTGNVTAAGTLATVATAGSTGSSTAIPVVTINAKGLTTSITTAVVVAPAGTLTGSTLASGVTASSLTSLGTIASLVVTAGTISTTPSAATDIANKSYVDSIAQGLDTKASVVAGTTANITLSGAQTIDGISIVATDRVLVKDQTLPQNNGIYLCAAGAWTRATDMNTWAQVPGAYVFVETGTTLADTGWVCTSDAGGTLNTTAITWAQFSGAGSGVSSITFGTTGLTPSTTTTGAVTVAGTLAVANGGTGLTAGTSGGVLAYTATGTLASSTALAASALVIGGGAGAAPSTTTTGTGVVTALGVNTGSAGAFVVNGGALGSPSSVGTMPAFTLGGTVSGGGNQINNVIIGTTTPLAGNFTTLSNVGLFTNFTGAAKTVNAGSNVRLFQTNEAVNYAALQGSYVGAATAAARVFRFQTVDQGLANDGVLSFQPDGGTLSLAAGGGATTIGGGLAVTGTLSSTGAGSIQGLTVGRGAGAVSTNTAVGEDALSNGSQSGAANTSLGFRASYLNTSGGNITAVGAYALYSNDTGSNNTGVGYGALDSNTSGSFNVGVGVGTLQANLSASNNTAVGYQAGYSNTTGTGGVAIGYQASYTNAGADYNTAIGNIALRFNTGGSNSAVGYAALYNNTTGNSNTSLGFQSLVSNTTASNNTAVGYQAGYSNTTGSVTALGALTGFSNTSGTRNVAVGNNSLYSNTTGVKNVAVGYYAFNSNSTGSNNVAIGDEALTFNSTASNNTAVGYQAGYTNVTGQYCTYIGRTAGLNATGDANTFVGAVSGYDSTGSGNTFVGSNFSTFYGAGFSMTTGSKNTILGGYSGNQGGLDIRTASNYIVLSDGDGNPRGFFDGSGNFLVGATATSSYFDAKANFYSPATYSAHAGRQGGAYNAAVQILWHEATSGDNLFVSFLTETSPTYRGSISYNRAGGLVAYNVTSDYRAKDISGPVTGSGALIDSTPVYMGKMKDATQERPMFLAHETPVYAHTGVKDAVDKDGKPVYQQMDASALIPVMWAELQSLRARVAQLESKP